MTLFIKGVFGYILKPVSSTPRNQDKNNYEYSNRNMMILAAKLREINKDKCNVYDKVEGFPPEIVDLDNYKDKPKEIDHLFDIFRDLVYNVLEYPSKGFNEQGGAR